MKCVLTFALCVSAAMAQQPSGKPFGFGFGKGVPKAMGEAKLHSKVQMANQNPLRTDSKKAKASFGPYTLVGKNDQRPPGESFSLDPRGQAKVAILPKGNLCDDNKDCTILTSRIGMTYEDGSEASPETGVYIHHLLAVVPGRPSTSAIGLCDVEDLAKATGTMGKLNSVPMSPFTGRGEDGGAVFSMFTSDDGKFNSGFHLGKNDTIVVQSDLVNYKNETQKVYLTYEYEYVEGFQGVHAITTLLSVTGCALIMPPKINMTGRAETTSRKFPITNDATLLNLRGHMHDGGEKMILAVNGKTVCESIAEYKQTALWTMSACGRPIDVKRGDWITLTSIYDVTKHPLRAGVMDPHSHAKNVLGMNDLMGMYGVTYATKPRAPAAV